MKSTRYIIPSNLYNQDITIKFRVNCREHSRKMWHFGVEAGRPASITIETGQIDTNSRVKYSPAFRLSLLIPDCQNDQRNFQGQVRFPKRSLALFLPARGASGAKNFPLHERIERARVAPFRPGEVARPRPQRFSCLSQFVLHAPDIAISIAARLISPRDLSKSYRTFVTPVIVKLRRFANNSSDHQYAPRKRKKRKTLPVSLARFRGSREWNRLARGQLNEDPILNERAERNIN